jgi:alpha-L-rhamnosidase
MFENGKSDEAYKLISREQYPGWGYMLRQGAKTLWEGWDDKESHCHAWNGYPIRLLQEYVCGIQAVSPGFTDVRIRPFFPAGLRYAEASILTVLGPIHVRWEFEQLTEAGALIHLKLSIPSGASASLDLELLQPDNANVRVFEYGGTEMRPLASIGRKMELSSGQYNLYIRTFRES